MRYLSSIALRRILTMRGALRMQAAHMPAEHGQLRTSPAGERRIRGSVFLVLGGLMVIATSAFTLLHLDDHHIVRVTIPGFLLGLGLLVACFVHNRSTGSETITGGVPPDRWEAR
jgi:hypothetical protein